MHVCIYKYDYKGINILPTIWMKCKMGTIQQPQHTLTLQHPTPAIQFQVYNRASKTKYKYEVLVRKDKTLCNTHPQRFSCDCKGHQSQVYMHN